MTQDEKIKELIQELLQVLDEIATDYDGQQYGLPLHDASSKSKMSERVYKWVNNIIATVDKKPHERPGTGS
jgi:MinD-like ATPase involved in chromosome partitioning or flagellar assembly